jgi:hypothetical protein
LRCYSCDRLIAKFIVETGTPHFIDRDFRRTSKTLGRAAGMSKEIRDRLQNHSRSDVSSKHYDKWEYAPEKRAATVVWEKFVDNILVEAAVAA